ncbi:MAG TPA: hypothetical protein VES62_05170 [Thermoleophilaceae bacterium]|nr:hypothetical protein [Thermoleophilaceae bacterium]
MTRRLRRRRARALEPGRGTLALGAAAALAVGAVVADELGRVWRRGSAPLPHEADSLLLAAEEVVAETAQVARAGYEQGSTRENAMFNLLSSFVITFLAARGISTLLRGRPTVGPFRNLRVGRRHIHHFVPGIVLAFSAGAAAILTREKDLEPKLAVPFGVGLGLTLDESALLLELDDVYWSREGLLSVQITMAVAALLASVALALRFLRRGERVVLEPGGP